MKLTIKLKIDQNHFFWRFLVKIDIFYVLRWFFSVMIYPTPSYIMRICCNCEYSQIIHCETYWGTLKIDTVFQNETSTYFWQIECVKMKHRQIYDYWQKNVSKWNKNPRKKRVLLYPLRLIFFFTWLPLDNKTFIIILVKHKFPFQL